MKVKVHRESERIFLSVRRKVIEGTERDLDVQIRTLRVELEFLVISMVFEGVTFRIGFARIKANLIRFHVQSLRG